MKAAFMAVGVLVLGMLVGCGPVEAKEELASEGIEASVDGAQVSPELMDAVLSKAPQQPDELLHAASSCQPTTTCADSVFCAPWSSLTHCGLTACNALDGSCRVCDSSGKNCQYRGGQKQLWNRQRQCWNGAGESCLEVQIVNNQPSICGCNDL